VTKYLLNDTHTRLNTLVLTILHGNAPRKILRTSILKTDNSVTIGHNHFASKSEVKAMIAVSKMKLAAKTSCVNPVEIYAQGVSEFRRMFQV